MGQRLAPRPRRSLSGGVSIAMYPEYVAADALAGVVPGRVTMAIDSHTACHAEYTYSIQGPV
jgi:hypothetical protein